MSKRSSPTFKNRILSHLSRFQERALSIFSPPSLASRAHSHSPGDNTGRLGGSSQIFSGAHDFILNNLVVHEYSTDNFMKELLQETIIGAEFDSSDRDPPPRCHPGTRLATIQRCLDFFCHGEGKLLWVVGPAAVGKSAIMQTVTENAPDGATFASIFFSVNERRNGSKTIVTIAYQLAVKCPPYYQFIHDQIILDPSLLQKPLSVQFNTFIVEPFVLQHLFEPSRRFLVIIDGLDQCDDPSTQETLLGLIVDFCITYSTSPIVWMIASRPEPHITSFFEKDEAKRIYTKEEVAIDSDEAREEVQRYLRDELKRLQVYPPSEISGKTLVFSPSSLGSPPRQHSTLHNDNTERLDIPVDYTDVHHPSDTVPHPPASSASAHTTPNSIPPTSPPYLTLRSKSSVCESYSSTSPPLLFLPQGQTSISQRPSYEFSGGRHFTINNPVFYDYSMDNFMEEFLQETIIGAEFNTSDRERAPRCHPGTHLAIIQRCLDFIMQNHDQGKLRWVVGPTGVGKSAIIQMVTEQVPYGVIFASIFFSVNGHRDGSKTIVTIAYQLAVKCPPYQFIRDQISLDPSLFRKSLSVQFNKFIVEPFMHKRLFESSCRFLMVIDGLDQCDNPFTQQKLLELIVDFCITYPTSPIVWMIASRPVPHIKSFFEKAEVKWVYTKEEIKTDHDIIA